MLNTFPEIKKLADQTTSVAINNLNSETIKELQILLVAGGFIKSKSQYTPGILDPNTISAYTAFKKKAYLEYPEFIGRSTAKALLEIIEIGKHPFPKDNPNTHLVVTATEKTDKQIKLPGNQWVSLNEAIGKSEFFNWAEATKNGQRIPETKTDVQNIIKLAEYLKLLKIYLDYKPLIINSWYRPAKINLAIGGVSNSLHIHGLAADIVVAGIPPLEVYKKINVWHGANGGLGKSTSFTHVDLRGYTARWIY